MRIGHGYDVHILIEKRKLILGGVPVPHHMGLLGHSDADVVLHAVCDAILGALGQGDIGQHFPDSDAKYKDANSRSLLREVAQLMLQDRYQIGNLDLTIVAQAPKLASYLPLMRKNISADLECPETRVNLKATTTEGLGFVGREQGIECHVVVVLIESELKQAGLQPL
jgi:2-C-methyl-D-erythritol 2,4-cyclodiphosphate synthase